MVQDYIIELVYTFMGVEYRHIEHIKCNPIYSGKCVRDCIHGFLSNPYRSFVIAYIHKGSDLVNSPAVIHKI